jgi:integrase/recombinase XerD
MTYIQYLKKIKNYSPKTIKIYSKYYYQLKKYNFNYKKLLLNTNKISINTKRLLIAAIKNYYKFKKDNRYNEIELPKKEIIIKEYIKFDEYKKYLKKINHKTKTGFQKRIIIRLLFETGIRSSELLNIKKKDIKNNKIHIYGKGRKQRKVLISN